MKIATTTPTNPLVKALHCDNPSPLAIADDEDEDVVAVAVVSTTTVSVNGTPAVWITLNNVLVS